MYPMGAFLSTAKTNTTFMTFDIDDVDNGIGDNQDIQDTCTYVRVRQ